MIMSLIFGGGSKEEEHVLPQRVPWCDRRKLGLVDGCGLAQGNFSLVLHITGSH